jgi:hypothetical protein
LFNFKISDACNRRQWSEARSCCKAISSTHQHKHGCTCYGRREAVFCPEGQVLVPQQICLLYYPDQQMHNIYIYTRIHTHTHTHIYIYMFYTFYMPRRP